MRYIYSLSLILLLACSDNGKGALKQENKLKQEAVAVAEKYAMSQLTLPLKNVDASGIIFIGNEQKKYIIDPSKVFTGLINDDEDTDAIVTLTSFRDNYIDMIEQLIIITEEGKLLMIRSVESDMKVLTIRNGIITAKVPTYSRNSPLYNCEACQEIKNYRYINGNLEEVK
ncbi:MAG: hypothetical protein A2X05_11235 [Bacteroidetes bacterium GWE2_41_25]|nr:MAG: hypothetical protein A2X03_13710 [Bacteroidetes bacterium GWA2_40_15]OFX93498.1 MAG: hypothetical protein A2X06_11180 [Bacteroidetes bacterium GWC2_40_22]OFX96078.1 MAG: hypothetical protein A2X05_11235 [Bacteroidetes bacterium GWE2_41_25]OFY59124.1 MAG: hypothetical protein A2X04_09640 [Bacteroidetes bacterium GWF2_41_9]HCU19547.1 hypothetical protein [Bacteroidales bacterium]